MDEMMADVPRLGRGGPRHSQIVNAEIEQQRAFGWWLGSIFIFN